MGGRPRAPVARAHEVPIVSEELPPGLRGRRSFRIRQRYL
jgi:hypothetical protein